MSSKGENPIGALIFLGVVGFIGVLVGLVNPSLEPQIRLLIMGVFGLLLCWCLLSVLNLTGFELESQPTLHIRRDSASQIMVWMRAKRPLSGVYLFAFTPSSEKFSSISPDEVLHFPLTLSRRGKHRELSISLYAPFPFGAGMAGNRVLETKISVLPRHVPAHLLNLPKLTSEFDRARLLRGSKDGVFKGIAEYNKEHSIREVNWKASARSGKLVVNEYEGVLPSRKVLVAPDPTAPRDEFEFVLDFTYSLLEMMHNDWQVFLYCFDGTIFHLPKNSIGAIEDYFLDLYPLGDRPNPDLEFPGLKILVTHSNRGKGPYLSKHWRILRAYDILGIEENPIDTA